MTDIVTGAADVDEGKGSTVELEDATLVVGVGEAIGVSVNVGVSVGAGAEAAKAIDVAAASEHKGKGAYVESLRLLSGIKARSLQRNFLPFISSILTPGFAVKPG